MYFNNCILSGNLTRDVELRYSPKGTAIANLSLAVTHKWKTEAGEKKEETSFFECVAFGRNAENIAQYTQKGHNLFIVGRLKQETWDDKQTGQKRYAIKVLIETFQLMNNRSGDGDAPQERRTTQSRPPQASEQSQPQNEGEDLDVPF